MAEIFTDFHFLRPLWLLLLLAIPILLWSRARYSKAGTNWRKIIDTQLFNVLVSDRTVHRRSWHWMVALCLGIGLASVSLAGPTWERIEQPVLKTNEAWVIVLDLSASMVAQDLSPSRIERSKLKIQEILQTRQDGFTSMVVYAGDAHVVAPLTDDIATLENLLRSLHPAMMPLQGSRASDGIRLAQDLFEQSDRSTGQIVLITDGIDDESSVLNVHKGSYPVSIFGVGTAEGAPVPRMNYGRNQSKPSEIYTSDGSVSMMRDNRGNIVIARLNSAKLRSLASKLGGIYSDLTLDDSDIRRLSTPRLATDFELQRDQQFDTWLDMGVWFAIPLAILLLPALRRGVLVILIGFSVVEAHANWFDDLFRTRDQQAHKALIEGDPNRASELFENKDWLGVARYRGGEYDESSMIFGSNQDERSQFNLGNSLAKSGQLEEALATYERLLEQNPEHEDAIFNRDLIKRILEEQKPPTDQQPQQSQGSESDQEQSDQSESETSEEQESQPQEDQSSQSQPPEEQQPAHQREDLAETQQERESADTQERWLRRIPDDPGGLLRTKFRKTTQNRIRNGEIRRPRQGEPLW